MNIYTKTNKGNIVIINNDRYSLRCRQRGKRINGTKIKPLQFISYKEMIKKTKLGTNVYGPYPYYTISKL